MCGERTFYGIFIGHLCVCQCACSCTHPVTNEDFALSIEWHIPSGAPHSSSHEWKTREREKYPCFRLWFASAFNGVMSHSSLWHDYLVARSFHSDKRCAVASVSVCQCSPITTFCKMYESMPRLLENHDQRDQFLFSHHAHDKYITHHKIWFVIAAIRRV